MIPFYQGQLDCFCAAYAVLNAMRLLCALPLSEARALFNDMLIELAADPEEFAGIALNAVDHTDWVRRLLAGLERGPHAVRVVEPFAAARTVFPRKNGPHALDAGKRLVRASGGIFPEALWKCLEDWIGATALRDGPRAVVFRFHRYLAPGSADPIEDFRLPDVLQSHDRRGLFSRFFAEGRSPASLRGRDRQSPPGSFPVVSHWTAAGTITGGVLDLADASSEPTAVRSISRTGFVTGREQLTMEQLVQIEPGTLFLLERR